MARLVYLGTPDAAVPPLRTLVAAGHDVALVVTRPDKRRGRGGALVPSPVKAAALELGLPVTDDLAGATDGRRRAGRGRGLRPDRPGGRARPAAHGEPPLLAPAALAGGGPGRAGGPGGRRRDGRLPDGRGGRARHRARLRRGGHGHRPRGVGRRAAGPPGGHRLPTCSRSTWPTAGPACRCPGTRPATRPTPRSSLSHELELDWDAAGARSCAGWCGSAGRGRRSGAGACGCWPPATPTAAERSPRWPPAGSTAPRSGPGAGRGCALVTVQPEGKRPMDADAWLRGVRPSRTSAWAPEPDDAWASGDAPVGSGRWPPSRPPARPARPPCGWPPRSSRPTSAAWPTPWPG